MPGGFTADIIDVRPRTGVTRPDVDVTHQQSPDKTMEFCPGGFADEGSLEFDLHYDGSQDPPIRDAKGTVTVTFAGLNTIAGEGYANSFDTDGPLGDKFTATMGVKWAGKVTPTAAP
ncbi:MAG: hypothetical protein ACR2RE_13595 [Geminicoccaceae bacterium]